MARRTGSRAIFDLTSQGGDHICRALERIGAAAADIQVKISPETFRSDFPDKILATGRIGGLWVECHPWFSPADTQSFWARLAELSRSMSIFPILGDIHQVLTALETYPTLPRLVLKGCEASGWVGRDTLFILYAAVRDRLWGRTQSPQLFLWGGVATPEAAAAFLSTGAQGIVFESLHWLTSMLALEDEVREGLARLQADYTELVGEDLACPVRLFNRGNSLAVKDLKESLASAEGVLNPQVRQAFVQRVAGAGVSPLEGRFSRDELIPLGVEAAFAKDFVSRFGRDTAGAIQAFQEEVAGLRRKADETPLPFDNSPTAREWGTRYPFIQGAMTWITDVPEFALAVAEAGGLPTLALGMMDGEMLTQRLGRLKDLMGSRPYAVNFLALPENPHRELQLAWIKEHRPRFVVIAAGDPVYARKLRQEGLEVMYLAPNEALLRLACQADVRYLILEGQEAGGHVGFHSTLTLAQIALELKRREPDLLAGRRLILAGGIYNRETAALAAMLGADAIQLGTAYLATREIVETGALNSLYQQQILAAPPGDTVITGETVGLRVRSLRSPKIKAIMQRQQELARGSQDEAEVRKAIEALAAGSFLIAARGLKHPEGPQLDESTCWEQGQFLSGACAGGLTRVQTVRELHQELAAGRYPAVAGVVSPEQVHPPSPGVRHGASLVRAGGRERLAVTGMSLVNSLGNSPEEVWAGCLASKSGIVPVPPAKWDHSRYYDPRPRTSGKTYCQVGAFQNIAISRKDLEISPQDFRTMTSATRLTLWMAAQAIERSGLLSSSIPRERIAILTSQNSGEAAATLSDLIICGQMEEILEAVGRVAQFPPSLRQALAQEISNGRLTIDDTTLLGRLNCTAGGFISNKYGFTGPSFAVSAACATSLVALYSAFQMIHNGVIDAAVVGGGEENLTPMHFLEFSALGALAGLSGREVPLGESSRPFDLTRDGMVLGEGGAMIIIERESAARRRGAPILAYITGMGASNNNLGMVESSHTTQEIALRAAFQDLPYGPEAVDLVECHATATFQGDVEEVLALKTFFSGNGTTALTSFKSQIGHTLGASGLNSLIRGIMGMRAGIFPPSINYRYPDPAMALEGSGLRICTAPEEWALKAGRPRRFQVNSFGFGGSNYVVHLEQCLDGEDRVLVHPTSRSASALSDSGPELPGGVFPLQATIRGVPYRSAVVAASRAEARVRLGTIEAGPEGQELPASTLRALGRRGVYLVPTTASPVPLAMVFPGQGSQYAGMGLELYNNNAVIRQWLDRAAAMADFDLLKLIFHNQEGDLQKTRWQQPATFSLEYAMAQYLLSLGLQPVALAGHSLGELVALGIAGTFSFEDGFHLVNMRARCMDKACNLGQDPGIMVATDAPLDLLQEKLQGQDEIHITNINAPDQVVLGGGTTALQALSQALKELGYRATALKVSMAFHSPTMRVIRDELEKFVDTLTFHPPSIPVISNTIRRHFPDEPGEIRRIIMAHLESPVYWMDNIRTLHREWGARLFLEIGPGDVLCNLISSTLGEEVECLPTCLPERESLTLNQAVARLLAGGQMPFPPRAEAITLPVPERPAALPAGVAVGPPASRPTGGESLERIIQREINKFVLETFGRFLTPALVQAIRREHDPNFSEADLERILPGLAPQASPATLSPLPGSLEAPASGTVSPPAQGGAAPAVPRDLGSLDVLEEVIRIIMDSTGYEREEIDPDMDLRADLAIRSSRIPVIMYNAESRFGIEIHLEEFVRVRTVRDLAAQIAEVITQTQGKPPGPFPVVEAAESHPVSPGAPVPAVDALERLVFQPVPVQPQQLEPLELAPEARLVILPLGEGGSSQPLKDFFRENYRVSCEVLPGALKASREALLPEGAPLTGVIFWLDDAANADPVHLEDLPELLTSCFQLVKALAASPQKQFALLLHRLVSEASPLQVLSQGILGMFLSAAQELPGVLFRSVTLEGAADLVSALQAALNRAQPVIETWQRPEGLVTLAGRQAPAPYRPTPALELQPGDVVVLSGGGYGITPVLARSLYPFQPRLVLLGRTSLDLEPEIRQLLKEPEPSPKALRWAVLKARPEISQEDLSQAISRFLKAKEVLQTLENLRAAGLEADYLTCDVSDPGGVKSALDAILSRFGRIDGVIHGAGILRDGFLDRMAPDAFAKVVEVKFSGAWNLFHAALPAGLRFFVALSSGAAILGNPGQVNYAAANRMMSALLTHFGRQHPQIVCKVLILPAVADVGMAADAEIRKILEKEQVGYIEPEELAEIFLRELFVAPQEDVWALYKRKLPHLATVVLEESHPLQNQGEQKAGTMAFNPGDFPLIESVSHLDLQQGSLVAHRTFSREKDLWIEDHQPFKFLQQPLVSTIMAAEAFLEAARLLYPYLQVLGLQDLRMLNMVACPPGVSRPSRIICRRVQEGPQGLACELNMETPDLSPTGRTLNHTAVNSQARVRLGARRPKALPDLEGFPVRLEELDTRPVDAEEVLEKYHERTDLQGRYRVMRKIDGTGPGAIRGHCCHHFGKDFSQPESFTYQYSPYVLEALLQLPYFYVTMREDGERRGLIPLSLGEVCWTRLGLEGEWLTVEARLRREDQDGLTFDARALDESGRPLMQLKDLVMRWFSP